MIEHPVEIVAPENLRECGPEIKEFDALLTLFEQNHPVAELYAIIELTPEEAIKHPTREPAKIALKPIAAQLNRLEHETNISPEEFEELRQRYFYLSRAVGMINNNVVDHSR